MNCQTFETMARDLAHDRMMEAAMRESALRHTETCARCAAQLADERALNTGFRALASHMQRSHAPAHLEERLRAAFREQSQTFNKTQPLAQPPPAPPAPVFRQTPARAPHWSRWAIAAAASVVLVMIAFAALRSHSAPPLKALEQDRQPSTQSAKAAPEQSPAPDEGPTKAVKARGNSESKSVPTRNLAPQNNFTLAANRKHLTPRQTDASSLAAVNATNAKSVAGNTVENEIATEFYPLTYAGGNFSTDGGQVVRVEVPRSALATMGLPVNIEHYGERVKADVVLGDDGVARAIRFVR